MEDLSLGRIAALIPEFVVNDLPLGRTLMMMMIISSVSVCQMMYLATMFPTINTTVIGDCGGHSIRTYSKDSFCRHL